MDNSLCPRHEESSLLSRLKGENNKNLKELQDKRRLFTQYKCSIYLCVLKLRIAYGEVWGDKLYKEDGMIIHTNLINFYSNKFIYYPQCIFCLEAWHCIFQDAVIWYGFSGKSMIHTLSGRITLSKYKFYEFIQPHAAASSFSANTPLIMDLQSSLFVTICFVYVPRRRQS